MFLLFAGNDYYPDGGAHDFQGAFDSVEKAKLAHDPDEFQYDGGWANIFDTDSLSISMRFSRGVWKTEPFSDTET